MNRAVRALLESAIDALWVAGEVTNWTRARSGHRYFTLKDERAQLRCVMWARHARALPADPEEGMRVRVHGTLTLYEARGEYQMAVSTLESEGAEGLWRLAFERLRKRLEGEGLLNPARKRPLPRFPSCVGVVTSPSGAALHDVVHVLGRRAPWLRVLVASARVQGEGASAELADALERLAASGACDAILVGRGGGSIEDLWAFNEEPLARAIAACPVPVVSAVGHEVDVTIADLVADVRAPTPSAGAEALAPDGRAVREELRSLPPRMRRGLRAAVERGCAAVDRGMRGLVRAFERRIGPARQGLDRQSVALERAVRDLTARRRRRLVGLAEMLQALSPLRVLERGYSLARAPDGRVLRRVDDFPPGRSFLLRVSDGTVAADATEPPHREARG